jgi:hypothetical protein
LHNIPKTSTTNKNAIISHINTIKLLPSNSLKNLPNEIISKNWLNSNVQNTWWNELNWRQYKVESQFEAAHLHEHWRKNILKSKKIIGTVSEYQACRELLWIFYTPSTMTLFQEKNETEISVQDVSIPSLTTVSYYTCNKFDKSKVICYSYMRKNYIL